MRTWLLQVDGRGGLSMSCCRGKAAFAAAEGACDAYDAAAFNGLAAAARADFVLPLLSPVRSNRVAWLLSEHEASG